jgi:ribosomal protein S18 acetylase RimI-like enzyme
VIKIEKMLSRHLGEVIALKVTDDQLKFVGAIDEILTNVNAQIRPHVITVDDAVVGFFLIDTVYDQSNDFAIPQSLGLRKFFIDTQHQGKGLAKQTLQLLPDYLMATYQDYTDVFLTVNCKNDKAKNLYLNSGFQDTNELYLEGPSGPQQIMKLAI